MPVAGLLLMVGACANSNQKPLPAPPVVNKALLTGTWNAAEGDQFVQKVEFAGDGSMKVTFKDVPQAIGGKYSWSDDRTLAIEYHLSDDVQKAYGAAAKKERDRIRPGLERTVLGKGGAARVSAEQYPDRLSGKQIFSIGLTQDMLVLKPESGPQDAFRRAK
jgi:hypothetical protein